MNLYSSVFYFLRRLIEHKQPEKGQRCCLMMSRAVSVWLICCSELLFVTEFSVILQSSALALYEQNLCLGFYWLLRPFNYNILGVSECLWQHKCWPTEGQITATTVSEHMLVPILYSFVDGLQVCYTALCHVAVFCCVILCCAIKKNVNTVKRN